MKETTTELIKKLVQMVNVEAISTKDLVKELENLYTVIEGLETSNKSLMAQIEQERKNALDSKHLLEKYEKEFVTPAKELSEMKNKFEKEKFEFDIEKKYVKQDRQNMLEIVKMLTSRFSSTLNENHSNGTYRNENHNWEKPNLQ